MKVSGSSTRSGFTLLRAAAMILLLVTGNASTVCSGEPVWENVLKHAPWTARDSAGEVVFHGKMWLLGGWTIDADGRFRRLNDIWNSEDGVSWNLVVPEAPWPVRNLPGSVVFRDRIWILGGFDGKKALNDVWYSSDGVHWRESDVPVPWSPRGAFGCVVYKDKIWVAGGFNLQSMGHMDDVWCSDDGLHWTRVTDDAPWGPRGMFPLVVFGGRMWLFGGGVYDEKSTNFHDVWYSSDGETWTLATDDAGWAERRFHIITVFRGQCWLLGGVTDGNVNLRDVWRSSDGVTWKIVDKAAPWGVRHEQMCFIFDDALWMFGGFSGDSSGEAVYGDGWRLR